MELLTSQADRWYARPPVTGLRALWSRDDRTTNYFDIPETEGLRNPEDCILLALGYLWRDYPDDTYLNERFGAFRATLRDIARTPGRPRPQPKHEAIALASLSLPTRC